MVFSLIKIYWNARAFYGAYYEKNGNNCYLAKSIPIYLLASKYLSYLSKFLFTLSYKSEKLIFVFSRKKIVLEFR